MKIEVKNGSFSYPKKDRLVLDKINFGLSEGDIMAVLGPNGAGKTTLLRCLLGFLKWKTGETLIDGENRTNITTQDFWKKVSYVPQVREKPPAYTVEEMVMLGRSGHFGAFSRPGHKDVEAVNKALERTGLDKIAKRLCSELSGGEYQMVLIARALASEAKVLVLDEPESNLDFKNQLMVLNMVKEIANEEMTCIFNTHYPAHALRWANLSFMLSRSGESIFGPTEEVITEKNISDLFGVRAVIGQVESEEGKILDVVPVAPL